MGWNGKRYNDNYDANISIAEVWLVPFVKIVLASVAIFFTFHGWTVFSIILLPNCFVISPLIRYTELRKINLTILFFLFPCDLMTKRAKRKAIRKRIQSKCVIVFMWQKKTKHKKNEVEHFHWTCFWLC